MAKGGGSRLSLVELVETFMADSDFDDGDFGLGNANYDPADDNDGDSDCPLPPTTCTLLLMKLLRALYLVVKYWNEVCPGCSIL
jgi:hypothetical protein